MKLEINLVKVGSVDAGMGSLISRSRYAFSENDLMGAFEKFFSENSSTFTAVVKDKRLVSVLSNISGLTTTQLQCIRYILCTNYGLDIWYWAVANEEINESDIDSGVYEYNVVDRDTTQFNFIPTSSKITQNSNSLDLISLYKKINDSFGLFSGSVFAGITNPLENDINAMKGSQEILGRVPVVQSTHVNYMLSFLHKEIKCITA